jgi:hypothetical protein
MLSQHLLPAFHAPSDWSTTPSLELANAKLDTTVSPKSILLVDHWEQFNAILALPLFASHAIKPPQLSATAVSLELLSTTQVSALAWSDTIKLVPFAMPALTNALLAMLVQSVAAVLITQLVILPPIPAPVLQDTMIQDQLFAQSARPFA